MKVYHKLKPIYNKESKILILGSMPSVKSREYNFYYANETNRFWKILESLFNVRLITNEDKITFLLKHNIALWDVIKSCDISNSSDSSIKNVIVNDIKSVVDKSNIKYIFITGKTALKYYNKLLLDEVLITPIYLPSPSSANASCSLDKLISEYKIILNYVD